MQSLLPGYTLYCLNPDIYTHLLCIEFVYRCYKRDGRTYEGIEKKIYLQCSHLNRFYLGSQYFIFTKIIDANLETI
jgi:hypothetical protein